MSRPLGLHAPVSVLLISVVVAYAIEPVLADGFDDIAWPLRTVGVGGAIAYAVLVSSAVWRGLRAGDEPTSPWLLIIAGWVGLGLYMRFGTSLAALPGSFAAAALLVLPSRRGVAVAALSLMCAVVVAVGGDLPARDTLDVLARTAVVMIAIYAIGRAIVLARQVQDNRDELRRLTVLEERVRVARDLHDLLGHGLTAIAMKSEVAGRMIAMDPARAEAETAAIGTLARESLADVRELVTDYRQMSLATELSSLRGLLNAAGIGCVVSAPDVPASAATNVIGWVVREAGTNVLRHSRATTCSIEIALVGTVLQLRMVNDGAGDLPLTHGNGLTGALERLATVGGQLTVDSSDGTFTLWAAVPTAGHRADATTRV
ncbi:MAG: sensor histidine kinase [Rhodococcus sp. (in: high G+C Gram-positive bacteria)]